MNTFKLESCSIGLEENFRAHESFRANYNCSAVWKVVRLIIIVIVLTLLEFLIKVLVNNIAEFFFNVSYNLELSRGCKVVTSVFKQRAEIFSNMFSCKNDSLNCMGNCIPFIDWNSVRNSISWINNNTCGSSRRIKRQNWLLSHVKTRHIKNFKHDLSESLSVLLRVEWSLCKQYWVLFRAYSKLIVDSVIPNFLHIVPVHNKSCFNGSLNF